MSVSQPARFGEDWSDDRIAAYLDRRPPAGEDADFHVLMTAYKHMRVEDFQRFLALFVARGRSLDACNAHGVRFQDWVASHPASRDFVQALQQAQGARA